MLMRKDLIRTVSNLILLNSKAKTKERSDGNMHVRNRKNNGSTSFAIDNMCYVNFRI